MLGVKTTQLKLPANETESWDFYHKYKDLVEFGGAQVRMYTENDLLVIEYDELFETKEALKGGVE